MQQRWAKHQDKYDALVQMFAPVKISVKVSG